VIFRATPQWFISMEEGNLRRRALHAIEQEVAWIPAWGKERIYNMIENRPDWCISRQRSWGVPIIVFRCQKCDAPVLTPAQAERVAAAFRQEGADAWFKHSPRELLGDLCVCSQCGSHELGQEQDILDVWFDSGASQAAVLAVRSDLTWPADLYLEGSDQHRGWFHSSLLCALGARDAAPYKKVLTHGFVMDGLGRKMSKSLGNVIQPQDMQSRFGADILRLWVAAEDYTDDVRLSEQHMQQLSEAYRRIRNTIRFLLGNLYDFNPAADARPLTSSMDKYLLHRLEELKARVYKAYEDFAFHVAYHSLHNFCSVDLSGFYMDVCKDCLYTSAANSRRRRERQTVLYLVLDNMLRMLAPILSFTAEEAWQHMPGPKEESIHCAGFAPLHPERLEAQLAGTWQKLLQVRAEVNKGLDLARKEKRVGNSLDARLTLAASGELRQFLSANLEALAEICMVSEIELADYGPELGIKLLIHASELPKCPRCWKRRRESADGELCHYCRVALRDY
jgi:isoleucyl-tRNA synthetase